LAAGERDQLLGKLQERYGVARDAAGRKLVKLLTACDQMVCR
jgi:uncharacterized protein YjbJ (UPF0337 family)